MSQNSPRCPVAGPCARRAVPGMVPRPIGLKLRLVVSTFVEYHMHTDIHTDMYMHIYPHIRVFTPNPNKSKNFIYSVFPVKPTEPTEVSR